MKFDASPGTIFRLAEQNAGKNVKLSSVLIASIVGKNYEDS